MFLLADDSGKLYFTLSIKRADAFVSPFPGEHFVCLLWDHDGRFTSDERAAVAVALLDSGCRVTVCGGKQCEAWHDAVDEEFVMQHLDDSKEDRADPFVMTTWHDGESPDEVARSFVADSDFDAHAFTRYLVLHVGTSPAAQQVDAAVRRHALEQT